MKPAIGQVWIGRDYGSLLKVVDVKDGIVQVKLLATGNPGLSDRIGKTSDYEVWYLQWAADYPGDLL